MPAGHQAQGRGSHQHPLPGCGRHSGRGDDLQTSSNSEAAPPAPEEEVSRPLRSRPFQTPRLSLRSSPVFAGAWAVGGPGRNLTDRTWPGLGEPQWSGQHGAWAWAQGAGGAGGGSQGRAGMTARSDLPGGTHRPLQGPEARDRAAAERHPRARLAHSLARGLGHGQQLLGASVSPSAKWG